MKRGLRWSFTGAAILRLGALLSGVLLARVLSPRDFGIYTVGAVALYVTASVNDMGIEPTLERWPDDLSSVAPTATTMMLGASLALFLGFWVCAQSFADLFNSPDGAPIVRLLSVALLINAVGTVSAAVHVRTFNQRIRTVADVAGMVVSSGLSISLALAGYGAYGLAWGHVAGNALAAVILIVKAPVRYRPGFSWPSAKLLLKSGIPVAGAGLITMGIQNLDYLVVGNILGANHLGLYLLAWNISSFPVSLCVGAIGHLSVAAFAQLQDDRAALHRAFEGSITAVTAVMLPLAVLMAVLSAPAVRTIYGTKWSESAGPLAFLALLGTLRVAAALVTDALVAIGRGRAMLVLQATWLVALIPALVVGARLHGISGVGMAHLGVFIVVTVPAYLFVLRSIGFPSWSLLRAVLRPAVGALGATVACSWIVRLELSDPVTLALGGTTGLAVYLLIVRSLWMPWLSARLAGTRSRASSAIRLRRNR